MVGLERHDGNVGGVGEARGDGHGRQEGDAQARPDHLHQGRQRGGGEGLLLPRRLGRPQPASGERVVAQAVTVLQQDQVVGFERRGRRLCLVGQRMGAGQGRQLFVIGNVGVSQARHVLLPKALPLLRARFPKLRLYLREDLTHRLIALLKAGQLDAALIALPYDMAGLAHAHVSNDELLAALPSTHPLAHEVEAPPSALETDDLILLEDGHCLRDHALAACGLRPPRATGEEEAFAATSLPTLVQMVGSGLGVTFLPAMAVAAGLADTADVSVMPLKADHPSREIVVAWRAGSSRAAEGRLLAETLRGA